MEEVWINPIHNIGIEIVAKRMFSDKSAFSFIDFLKKSLTYVNKVLSGDILASLIYYSSKLPIDLGGLVLDKSSIFSINFSKSLADNFIIVDSFIDELDISMYSFSKVTLKDCLIKNIYGISSDDNLPVYMASCIVEVFDPSPMEIRTNF